MFVQDHIQFFSISGIRQGTAGRYLLNKEQLISLKSPDADRSISDVDCQYHGYTPVMLQTLLSDIQE